MPGAETVTLIRAFRKIVHLKFAIGVGLQGSGRGRIAATNQHLGARNGPMLGIVHDAFQSAIGGRQKRSQ